MRPGQVLDMHGDLLTRLKEPQFRRGLGVVVAGEARTRQVRAGVDPESPRAEHERDLAIEETMSLIEKHVEMAYAFRVTDDMCDLVMYAASQLEEEDTWDKSLAPVQVGLVRFQKPMILGGSLAHEEVQLRAHWLLWGPGPLGRTMLWWLGDRDAGDIGADSRADEKVQEKVRALMGRWMLQGWDQFPQGMSLGSKTLPLGVTGLDLDDPEAEELRRKWMLFVMSGEQDDAPTEMWQSNDARYAHALWLLLNQSVTSVAEEVPDRPARRRALRKGIPDRVTVIALRRIEGKKEPGETHVEWKHRWLVRGHWRWQACGPRRSQRRRIWINDFIKGPEDKPLVITDKVYDFRR